MIAFLRKLRHGRLKFLNPVWVLLGRIYRLVVGATGSCIVTRHKIGSYGPFKFDSAFAFSDFENWGGAHNSGFENCIEACRGKKCVLDIGAHIGLVTMPMSQITDGKIYSFEPAAANNAHLKSHIALNNIENVEVFNYLIGDEDKAEACFYEQKQATGMNSIIPDSDKGEFIKTSRKQVCLDSFCKKHDLTPEIIKIDIEGAEIYALRGAKKLLKRCSPVIYLSVHPYHLKQLGSSVEELDSLIDELGYRVKDANGKEVTEYKLDEYILTKKE